MTRLLTLPDRFSVNVHLSSQHKFKGCDRPPTFGKASTDQLQGQNFVRCNPDKHHRRSIRLKGYDYTSAGMYFLTICTHQRECLFGEIVDGEMRLNELGKIVTDVYLWLATQYSYVHLDAWIVMPNHLHGILVLTDDPRRGVSRNAPTEDAATRKSLGRLIGAFKTVSTKRINLIRDTSGSVVWQRNYYEHIIRNEKSLHDIRQYIHHNPISWHQDQLHPDNPSQWEGDRSFLTLQPAIARYNS